MLSYGTCGFWLCGFVGLELGMASALGYESFLKIRDTILGVSILKKCKDYSSWGSILGPPI